MPLGIYKVYCCRYPTRNYSLMVWFLQFEVNKKYTSNTYAAIRMVYTSIDILSHSVSSVALIGSSTMWLLSTYLQLHLWMTFIWIAWQFNNIYSHSHFRFVGVKVYCTHTAPDYSLPWQKQRQYTSTGRHALSPFSLSKLWKMANFLWTVVLRCVILWYCLLYLVGWSLYGGDSLEVWL